jgi:hypothetical protein
VTAIETTNRAKPARGRRPKRWGSHEFQPASTRTSRPPNTPGGTIVVVLDDAHVLTRLEKHMTVLRRAAMALVAAITLAALSVVGVSGVANADPGIGWGAPGPGIGGWGGPASGLGLLPGLGWGLPGVGLGGVGGPASGLGVLPGVGWGLPGPGIF